MKNNPTSHNDILLSQTEDTKLNNPGPGYGHEDKDSGPFLVVISLLAFFSVILGAILLTVAEASEGVMSSQDQPDKSVSENSEKIEQKWKPPVAKKMELPAMVDEKKAKVIADKWGVELLSLRLTAARYMMDFRFKVLDENKAVSFFDHRIKPYLISERSNAKLPVPMAAKVGAFRPTNRGGNIKSDKTYYMVFGNPDAHVKPGDKVSLVIGDFKAEHLTVN